MVVAASSRRRPELEADWGVVQGYGDVKRSEKLKLSLPDREGHCVPKPTARCALLVLFAAVTEDEFGFPTESEYATDRAKEAVTVPGASGWSELSGQNAVWLFWPKWCPRTCPLSISNMVKSMPSIVVSGCRI